MNESPEAVTFLQEHGIDLSVVVQCGGHSVGVALSLLISRLLEPTDKNQTKPRLKMWDGILLEPS